MRKRYLLLLASIFIFATLATGQTPEFPPIESLTPENLFNAAVDPIYSALVLLFGYISAYVPGVNRFSPFIRVVAFGLVAGLGVHLFGGASIWKLAFSYFLSSGMYITFFKNILPSPAAKKTIPTSAASTQ